MLGKIILKIFETLYTPTTYLDRDEASLVCVSQIQVS